MFPVPEALNGLEDASDGGPPVFGRGRRRLSDPPMFSFGDNGRMLDTHAVARSLTDAGFTPTQADVITNALRFAVEHGDLDKHAVARSLTDAEFTPTQADAITNALHLVAEHRRPGHV